MNASSQVITPDHPVEDTAMEFETIFDAHYVRVARVIGRIVHDPARAEELAVDVFWKLWRSSTGSGENVGAWLSRAAVRAGLDELRKQARRAKYERFVGWLLEPRTPEALHIATEEQLRVRSILALLTSRDAEMLVLRSDGLTYQELAQALGLNPASIGTLLSRAQDSFRKEYTKRYGI
ncbi:MAG TPA: sigma-70 family RNA polymerase sigma factor [Bryobacteraceae bacterium]|nr:sigma-70 family RNA polymerase sigma factor [Bryobacteraceae bacterium]